MAAGLARQGMKPVCAIYSTFLQRAYDMIIHDAAISGEHVVFAIDRAGLVGEDGETHQGVYDIAFLRTLPGMCILSPATQEELAAMIPLALTQTGPVAIRYNRGALMSAQLQTPVEIGKWEEIAPAEEGKIIVLASGRMVKTALSAAEGLPVSVINVRSIKPMDEEMLLRIKGCGKPVFTVEDGILSGGFGEAVKAKIGNETEIISFGVGEQPVKHAPVSEQDKLCGMDAESIREKLLEYLEREV